MSTKLTAEQEQVLKHLHELRHHLLNLHKSLLESERIYYEKTVGQITSPSHFLQLLARDPWFVWLQPLSHLIVTIDEALEVATPPPADELDALVSQAYRLLVPAETTKDDPRFAMHYFEAMQRDPDVVVAHAELAKLRRTRKPAR